MYSIHPCVCICLPQNCGSSPVTLPKRINCPLLLYAIFFCSGSCSNDRITITRDSHFHRGIFACQPVCLLLSLSQFVILSLSYFLVFAFPFIFYPTHCFCHSFSQCLVDEKQYISCEEQKTQKTKGKKIKLNHRDKIFHYRWKILIIHVLLYMLMFLESIKGNDMQQKSRKDRFIHIRTTVMGRVL